MNIPSELRATGKVILMSTVLLTANEILCNEVPAIGIAELDLKYDRCNSQKKAEIETATEDIKRNKAAVLKDYEKWCSTNPCPEVNLGEIIDTELGKDVYYCSPKKLGFDYNGREGVVAETLRAKRTRAINFYEASFVYGECGVEEIILHETIHTATAGLGHPGKGPDWIYEAGGSAYDACIAKTLPPGSSPFELLMQR